MIEFANYAIPEDRDNDYFSRGRLRIYAPRTSKQNLLVCNPDSPLGLATGWADPGPAAPDGAEETFAIIASMRTPGGVELMLHNLASNPSISDVITYAASKNDDTPQGMMPRRLINDLWNHGISDQGVVINNGYQLRPELIENGGIHTVRTVLSQVGHHDLSDLPRTELLGAIRSLPYSLAERPTHQLPEFAIRAPETLPSEYIATEPIRETNAFRGWLKLMGNIARFGPGTKLETKSGVSVRELPFARVVLTSPRPFDNMPDWARNLTAIDLSPESLEEYADRFIFPDSYMQEIFPGVHKFIRPANEKYLYAELIHAYPRRAKDDEFIFQIAEKFGVYEALQLLRSQKTDSSADAVASQVLSSDFRSRAIESLPVEDRSNEALIRRTASRLQTEILLELYKPPFNQLAKVIERMGTEPDDVDKIIMLWDPEVHGVADSGRPCLMKISFFARQGELHTEATFRSHDIPKGWIFNLYGVWRLADYVATLTGLEVGTITADSESAHAYQADLNWVSEVFSKEYIEQPISTRFDAEQADPRGNFQIVVRDRRMIVTHTHPITNQAMLELTDTTARGMMAQIEHHKLISQTSHAMDIALQLYAAEIAIATELPFTQDRPHELSRALKRKLNI